MPNMTRTKAATCGLLIPAAMALGMSADTSYRFLGAALGVTNRWERGLLCGVAEAAIVALTVYAWATRTKGPAYLAYAAVLIQSIPAFRVSGATGGPIRVVLGPVLLAVMLHLLLGLELRMSGERAEGILGAALREMRERLTASLGIGRRGADSAAIARSRAADRAVSLADKVAATKPGTRKHTRRSAALAAAIDAARHGLAPDEADEAEAAIVARVVRRKSAASLATIETRHDWTATIAPRHRDTTTGTATTEAPAVRDTDHDTATPTATTPVAADRDNSDTATEAPRHHDTATATTEAPAARDTEAAPASVVVDIVTKRQAATTRDKAPEQGRKAGVVAATATDDAIPSVAQMVREAMAAGITDRDTILTRVHQVRPEVTRQTVARAMQRHTARVQTTGQGQYL